ncbi:serine/threonine-protein kinase [Myxococcus landrumensis]|uniref:Serine/threonine protein kinase n=1 Tax=Myxococcus landrumensis TaxID=2813577 RepID=A0ABX7MWS0_9BACT|nr:serine/threonine-protein kinase [Myxococcus landrumus]QSQ10746.1 serine/threonine protein kinase [Myxococcus landrumus]
MAAKAIEFGLPKGAILFSADGYSYEFREHLGVAHHGASLFLARRRTPEGHPRGKVLLKAIPDQYGAAGNRVRRARRKLQEEVRIAERLDHPGILKVLGLHKIHGYWYAVLEHPSGTSLSELLTLVSEMGSWLSPELTLYIGSQLANALDHAHTATDEHGTPLNIVHRAVDPDRIFLDWDGAVQLSDFGAATSTVPGRLTSSGRRPHGDFFYASPEALLGGKVDARSDLFSVGLVLLELVSGRSLLYPDALVSPERVAALSERSRNRVTRSLKRASLAGMPPTVETAIWQSATFTQADVDVLTRGLPQSLRVLLGRLLSPAPTARYQSARELAGDISAWMGDVYTKADAVAELAALAEMSIKGSQRGREEGESLADERPRGSEATTTARRSRDAALTVANDDSE